MAKRPLGIGKAAKSKKQKKVEEPAQLNELTVELAEEIDANDELGQLKGLWHTYIKSDKDNELVVNGVIHECDRLLRNNEGKDDLPDFFYSIYGMGLYELAHFHTDDNKKVKEYFEASLERIESGLEKYPESIDILFAKSKILVNQIPLQHISQLDVESDIKDHCDLAELLDNALAPYELAEKTAESSKQYELFNTENLEILQALDDLLEIVDNFGKDTLEGEDDEDDDSEPIELHKNHPLHGISQSDKYNQWWRDHTIKFLEFVDLEGKKLKIDFEAKTKEEDEVHDLIPLRRELCYRLGQSYLQESEVPTSVFTSLKYDEDFKDETELHGLTCEQAQNIGQELITTALKYLKGAKNENDPETWVNEAEAMISLGNLYEVDSAEQEKCYKDAEKILNKANNVTNGKYEDVLENLLQG